MPSTGLMPAMPTNGMFNKPDIYAFGEKLRTVGRIVDSRRARLIDLRVFRQAETSKKKSRMQAAICVPISGSC